jgi:hypothetical protein
VRGALRRPKATGVVPGKALLPSLIFVSETGAYTRVEHLKDASFE